MPYRVWGEVPSNASQNKKEISTEIRFKLVPKLSPIVGDRGFQNVSHMMINGKAVEK